MGIKVGSHCKENVDCENLISKSLSAGFLAVHEVAWTPAWKWRTLHFPGLTERRRCVEVFCDMGRLRRSLPDRPYSTAKCCLTRCTQEILFHSVEVPPCAFHNDEHTEDHTEDHNEHHNEQHTGRHTDRRRRRRRRRSNAPIPYHRRCHSCSFLASCRRCGRRGGGAGAARCSGRPALQLPPLCRVLQRHGGVGRGGPRGERRRTRDGAPAGSGAIR